MSERERERVKKREGERERERKRERDVEYGYWIYFIAFKIAALKGMMGALAPFSYLV